MKMPLAMARAASALLLLLLLLLLLMIMVIGVVALMLGGVWQLAAGHAGHGTVLPVR